MTAQTLGKTRAIQTRVTEEEGERLDQIAMSEGCSVADLARRALRQVFPNAFSLPSDGTNRAESVQTAVIGENPDLSAPPPSTPVGGVSNIGTARHSAE